MKSFILAGALALGFLAVPLNAQICDSANDTPNFLDNVSMGGPNLLLAIKHTAAASFGCTRIETFTGEGSGTNSIGIWSHDAANNKPLTNLGTATWSMTSVNSWQGANLTTPVPMTIGTTYWVVWGCVNGSQCPVEGNTFPGQQYRGSFDGGANWNGPFSFNDRHWKLRLYCGSICNGYFKTYGSACPNSIGTKATLNGTLCPTPNGNITIDMTNAVPNTFAILFVGAGTGAANVTPSCPLQILPLYPPSIPFAFPASGAVSFPTVIPASVPTPLDIYIQTLFVDSGIPYGISGTNPLQIHIQ